MLSAQLLKWVALLEMLLFTHIDRKNDKKCITVTKCKWTLILTAKFGSVISNQESVFTDPNGNYNSIVS